MPVPSEKHNGKEKRHDDRPSFRSADQIQGIKTKIVSFIREIVRLDPSTTWVEPFVGSGVVGFNVAPKRAVFADTNPHVIAFYRAIQAGEITASRVRAFLEAEGGKLREKDDPLDFLFLNRSCFNGMIRFNRKGELNVPYGHKPERFAKAYVTKVVNQVAHVEDLLRANDRRFVEQSFEETLASAPEMRLSIVTLRTSAGTSTITTAGTKGKNGSCATR